MSSRMAIFRDEGQQGLTWLWAPLPNPAHLSAHLRHETLQLTLRRPICLQQAP
jgi:hypothetical protein